ncbi:MAG: GTPase Era [Thermodesulfatator sp.]|nr:MAG: GTPase Era [Thermodesulfatator sp.]
MEADSDQAGIKEGFRSGFVGIIGAPNVGKSTLLNSILGEKVAITTPKPQTTRTEIRGILTGQNFQIVFVDTPGIHYSRRLLNKKLVRAAERAVKDVDILLFLVDITNRNRKEEAAVLELITKLKKPVILVLNKIDKVAKENLLPVISEMSGMYPFQAVIPVSAKYSDGIDELLDEILKHLEEGPQFYDSMTTTDQSVEKIIEELVREKIFLMAEQEVPYSTAVKVEDVRVDGDKMLIRAIIYVERPSQKGIVIGKHGKFIKKVGTLARMELEKIFDKRVFLDLWVKVLKDWSRNEKALRRLGFQD